MERNFITPENLLTVRAATDAAVCDCTKALMKARQDANLAVGYIIAWDSHGEESPEAEIVAQDVKAVRDAMDLEKCVMLGED